MKKIIRLTESDLTRLIKRVVSEAVAAPEPVVGKSMTVKIYFTKEGGSVLANNTKTQIKNWLRPYIKMSMPTIKQFYRGSEFKLPKFITVGASTTSGGDYEANSKVAQARLYAVVNVVRELFEEMGINKEMIQKFVTTNSNYTYQPTSVDANLFDRKSVKPMDKERFAYITVNELKTVGLGKTQIGDLEDALRIARGYNVDPDETGIALAICNLDTYSDIKDLNYELRDFGGLQGFINQTITDGLTKMGSDSEDRRLIQKCLNAASRRSNKGDIAAIAGDKLTILLK
jgi:hypothetical protein